MKEYVFSFSNEMESNGNKYNLLEETVYGIYDSEKEAILDAMKMYEYYNLNFTHLFVGQAEYFIPRIYAESILEDLAMLADNDGYDDGEYLADVKKEHLRELDRIFTEAYLKWEKKHPEYRNRDYSMGPAVRYSISHLKEEMENMRKGVQDDE